MSALRTVRVTQRDALNGLARAVQARGADYFVQIPPYAQTWRHVIDAESVCIVGEALVQLGVPVRQVQDLDSGQRTCPRGYFVAHDISSIVRHGSVEWLDVTPSAVKVLAAAQRSSDAGECWGDALDAARVAARHTRKDTK